MGEFNTTRKFVIAHFLYIVFFKEKYKIQKQILRLELHV